MMKVANARVASNPSYAGGQGLTGAPPGLSQLPRAR